MIPYYSSDLWTPWFVAKKWTNITVELIIWAMSYGDRLRLSLSFYCCNWFFSSGKITRPIISFIFLQREGMWLSVDLCCSKDKSYWISISRSFTWSVKVKRALKTLCKTFFIQYPNVFFINISYGRNAFIIERFFSMVGKE